jgi:acetyl-CoA synthetase
MISPLPGASVLKPGAAAWPFFGVAAQIVDEAGQPVVQGEMGRLVITQPWPGMLQTVYGKKERFAQYFTEVPGVYLTGDQAHQDSDGFYYIAGRSDDVIKVSGHRIGTEEVESALLQHVAVAEAAVVPIAHEIKGQAICAFVSLKHGVKASESLRQELLKVVRDSIGGIAVPERIQWAHQLPKTRSGKIMRRILRKLAQGETQALGDLSTLADPSVVETLIQEMKT